MKTNVFDKDGVTSQAQHYLWRVQSGTTAPKEVRKDKINVDLYSALS